MVNKSANFGSGTTESDVGVANAEKVQVSASPSPLSLPRSPVLPRRPTSSPHGDPYNTQAFVSHLPDVHCTPGAARDEDVVNISTRLAVTIFLVITVARAVARSVCVPWIFHQHAVT